MSALDASRHYFSPKYHKTMLKSLSLNFGFKLLGRGGRVLRPHQLRLGAIVLMIYYNFFYLFLCPRYQASSLYF